jgi:N-acetylglucosaminyldiphosphoundecaprenol N-acetyl-beta-D-mannosaminyltransferase
MESSPSRPSPGSRPQRAPASGEQPERVNVLGVGVSAINLDSAVEFILRALERNVRGYVCVTGVHGVSEAQNDPDFRAILNRSFLTTPDGMPMVWMGRLQGFHSIGRVYGPDLMLRICALSADRKLTHFLYGGVPGVVETLKRKLESQFPGLQVVGTFTPPFRPLTDQENEDLRRRVAEAKPDLFWVGLSTPKQEKFMAEYCTRLDARLFLGVGAAFDFHTGRLPQAPRWMQRCGLEWLFRLKCEPRRLWKRYCKNNPLFVLRALGQLTRISKYRLN